MCVCVWGGGGGGGEGEGWMHEEEGGGEFQKLSHLLFLFLTFKKSKKGSKQASKASLCMKINTTQLGMRIRGIWPGSESKRNVAWE